MPDQIADDLLTLFQRFISAGEAELSVLVLWTIHTHAFIGGNYYTPYLAITSAEKQSGKTRVLEVLKSVVRDPLITASISPAALARSVDKRKPTLLMDELDALLKGDKEMSEALRGILNSGFQADGVYTRMVGVGTEMKPEHFSTFSPKAMAGIGALPDTIADRCITIRLERSPRGTCEKFRPRGLGRKAKQLHQVLEGLKARAATWAKQHIKILADAEPECPSEFSDRQQDIAEPLLAIADLIGGNWPDRARESLVTLFTSSAAKDTSIRVRLLTDIKAIFDETGLDKIATKELVEKLCEIETSPWGEWRHGKPMTDYALAGQLKPFEIFPRSIRIDDHTKKGYVRESFLSAWERYVTARDPERAGSESAISTNVYAGCYDVTPKKGGTAGREGKAPSISSLPSCEKCGSFALYGQECQSCGHPQRE